MDLNNIYALDKNLIAAAFDRAAREYEARAVLQFTVAERMIERLDLFKIKPRLIVDVGSGSGHGARLLARYYKGSQVIALDLSTGMLMQARRLAPRFRSPFRYVSGDAECLPIEGTCVDMIYSNLTLQWCNDLDRAFGEFRRVLKPSGLLLFSTFGPDTLKELRASWATVDDKVHVHHFIDMHDLGDALIRAGFSSPVMDVENFTLTYRDLTSLMRDLKALGASNVSLGRRQTLTGKNAFGKVAGAYEAYRRDQCLPATHEVVYGHAWAPERHTRPQDGSTVASFPISRISRIKDRRY